MASIKTSYNMAIVSSTLSHTHKDIQSKQTTHCAHCELWVRQSLGTLHMGGADHRHHVCSSSELLSEAVTAACASAILSRTSLSLFR